jgi:hypothetical protein
MAAKKDPKREYSPNWGGPRENSGGPRKPGPGKRIGRPTELAAGEKLERLDVRLPPTWRAAIEAHGSGNFSRGLRKLIAESGIVPKVE